MKVTIPLVAILILISTTAKADSDGYFCSSSKFLAYEFWFSNEPSNQHKLYVYRFGTEPEEEPGWTQIPIFQVYGMKCFDDRVELVGWGKQYVFSVSTNMVKPALEEALESPGKLPGNFSSVSENLAGWSPVTRGTMPREHTYELWPESPEGRFEIQIVRKNVDAPCEYLVESRLVKVGTDSNDKLIQLLYSGRVPTECGG